MYELLEQSVLRYKDRGKLYITGDFNSRTASETDLIDFDKYLDDDTFYESIDKTSLTTRVNKDDVIDSYGRRLLSVCKITELFIANGRLGEDLFGTPRPIPWIRPRMYHAGFHDGVMGNHANTITSLNGSETNGYNTPR